MIDGRAPMLIVDDDEPSRRQLSRRLTRSGFAVETCACGADALARLRAGGVELVLLDVRMPGMSGLEVLKEIRRTWSPSALPVLVLTGNSDTDDVVEALRLGADDYLTKPIDYAVVLAKVQAQLSRRRADERLRESEERLALAVRGANDGVWDWDLDKNTVYFSPRWKAMVGAAEHDIGGDPREWFDRIHPDDLGRVRGGLEAHLSGDSGHFESEHRIRHGSGVFRWVRVRGLAVRNADGAAVRIAGSQVDVTEGKVLDTLTGLPNHYSLNDRLERALAQQEPGAHRCAVLLFDIDGLKLVNDSLGHTAGDELIQAVAERLDASMRTTDTIVRGGNASMGTDTTAPTLARVGGDEFIILLTDVRDVADVRGVAQRLQQAMALPFVVAGQQVFVTASIGIAISHPEGSPKELLRDADTAMNRAKLSGKHRFEVFDATMRHEVQRRLSLETDLRLAVARDEFVPYFQPVVDVRTGRLAGFEALLRWRHPTRGIVPPMEFVPVIEANGLILAIGRRCFERVCRQVRKWLDTEPCPDQFWVSVNFSRQQFLEDGLVPWLLNCLAETRLSPAHVVIEITESAAVQNVELTTAVLRQLGDAGVNVLMDDFGTGHSSLVCLHQLPLGGLKLDRTLLLASEAHPALLGTVVSLANSLGLSVTAEGIENEAQCGRVAEGGCDFAQGFFFEQPVAAEHAGQLIGAEQSWLAGSSARRWRSTGGLPDGSAPGPALVSARAVTGRDITG